MCPTPVRPALGLASLLALVVACAAPRQGGEIVVAPGAAERLAVAWRFGYAGVPAPERAATTRVLADVRDVVLGSHARPGDVLLENGIVTVVIAGADGTERGGALIDAWSEERRIDELRAARVVVGGRRVVARSVRGGVDAQTRAAWVDVIGVVEVDGTPLEVATRYDVAPGVDGVLVHTTFTAPTSPAIDLAVGDELEGSASGEDTVIALDGPPAALVRATPDVAHAIVALDGPAAIVDPQRATHVVPIAAMGLAPGALALHSRIFLVVPGSGPITVAGLQARALGRPVSVWTDGRNAPSP